MNEKIKKLYNKSLEKYTYSDCDGDNNHGIKLNEEKFAELIIKECIRVIEEEQDKLPCDNVYYTGIKNGVCQARDIISKHFGVE